jgi:hypothetical protein
VVQWRETAAAAAMRRRRCPRPFMPLASWSVAAEHGMRADSRHSGTAGTRAKGVDATFMLLERYGCGIHVVSVRRRRSGGHVSPVTAAHQERRNTSSQDRDVCYPAQDQLQLNGTAARLRPDAIRTTPSAPDHSAAGDMGNALACHPAL